MLPSEASSSEGPIRSIDGTSHVVSPDGQSGYSRIQTALDEADSGDAVVLEKGVYVENLVVDKSIEILGESGNCGDTVVAAADPEKTVLSASRDGGLPVTIRLSGVSLCGGTARRPLWSAILPRYSNWKTSPSAGRIRGPTRSLFGWRYRAPSKESG